MSEPAVSVRELGKVYRMYARPIHRLMELATRRPHHVPFPALADVSFDLRQGETLGIVGRNGAGKSTLLKILAGVAQPTAGHCSLEGKTAAILELGSGFHPEFTGRQNIRLNAAMFGLSEAEIEEKTPAIIAFAEIGDFIDQPVKTYSTGMSMRLGFSIATQVEPDILIIDEALSVGDGRFQKKCMDKMVEFIGSGGTLLFCSHALYYLATFCERSLWLRRGRTEALGPTAEVIRDYESFLLRGSPESEPIDSGPEEPSAESPKTARLLDIHLDGAGERAQYAYLEPWAVVVEWETEDPQLQFHLGLSIDRVDGVQVASFFTLWDELPPLTGSRRYRLRLALPRLPLLKGEFSLFVHLMDENGVHAFDQRAVPSVFRMASDAFEISLIRLDHEWERLEPAPASPSPERPATRPLTRGA